MRLPFLRAVFANVGSYIGQIHKILKGKVGLNYLFVPSFMYSLQNGL